MQAHALSIVTIVLVLVCAAVQATADPGARLTVSLAGLF